MIGSDSALLLIDIQNDFLPGGALAVPEGDRIIPYVNKLQKEFDCAVASQDWHPRDHLSFASQHKGKKVFEETELRGLPQTLWPDHCIQNSHGAQFAGALNTDKIRAVFRKGMNRDIDSYSCFYDNGHLQSTGLNSYLRGLGIGKLYFVGLAADYCVYFSALDAAKEGFTTFYIESGTRYISEEMYVKAKNEMRENGVQVIKDF